MVDNPNRHHRRSIRLKHYDYSQAGGYFVTLCTQDRGCLFGDIVDGEMRLNDLGRVVLAEWQRTVDIRAEMKLDAFVVMPNHVHGIVFIEHNGVAPVGAHGRAPTGVNVYTVGTDDNGVAPVGAHGRAPLHNDHILQRSPKSLGAFVAGFKSAVTQRINALRGTPAVPVWQRNYYEQIIRDETSLNRIQKYILDNPGRWTFDPENPLAITPDTEGI